MQNNHSKKPNEQHWMLLVLYLKEVALDNGYTQEKLEEKTGLTQSTLSRFFALKWRPRLDTYLKVANAMEVNLFFEHRSSKSDLNVYLERAMTQLGRRPDQLPKN